MVQKRIFNLKIIDTNEFLKMSPITQNLYFHLESRADDDGFVANPKKIIKITNSIPNDIEILITKKFVILSKNGIYIIRYGVHKNNKKLTKQTRRSTSFPKEDYNEVCDAYKKYRKIEPQGQEWQPIQQSIKSMFMSYRSVEDIIGCMKWLAENSEDWTENWTINTVKMKIAFYLSREINKPTVGKY